mgnify:CR=1 FL=1
MVDQKYIISQDKSLLEALSQINFIATGPLCLFVVDETGKMVGTLTDGDSRRAFIKGATVTDSVSSVMNRDFNCLHFGVDDDVAHLHQQRDMKMKLVPVLDKDGFIIDIIDLERCITKLPIDAVLMAGGKGERLRPLTLTTPKPLLPVGNKAIIDYNVERLISYGVKDINVTVNYLKEQIEEHFSKEINGIKVNCVREPQFLGTIGSIKFIKEFHHDTVLLMNSDLFTNVNYEDFYMHFIKHNAEMSVATIPYSVNVPYGIFELDGRNIKGIKEKPSYNYYANAGIYLLKKEVLEFIPDDTFFNATDLIEKLISMGKNVIRFPLTGYWIDIGKPEEYKKAQDLVNHLQ